MTAAAGATLGLMAALLGASAFFSGSETALFGLTEQERTTLANRSALGGRTATRLLREPSMLLITILLGNMVVNVLFLSMASLLAMGAETTLVKTTYTVAPLLLLILFGEVTPKLVATGQRARWCALFAPLLFAFHQLIAPLRVTLHALVVAPAARLTGAPKPTALSAEELGELLELSAAAGAIDPVEAELIDDVVELSSLRVRDIMTPRVHLCSINAAAGRSDIEKIARSTSYSRLPVHTGSLDAGVVGVVDIQHYLARTDLDSTIKVKSVMDAPFFIPQQARLDQLLLQLEGQRRLAAIVVDEYGGVAGMVTFGDITRRMSQSLRRDNPAIGDRAAGPLERIGPAIWRAPGRLSVHDLVEAFGPTDRRIAGTVAGLINAELGRLGAPGDRVTIGNVVLEVETVQDRAIETVIVSLTDPANDGEGP